MDPRDILDVTVNRKIPVPAGNPLQSCSSEPAATMTELMCEYSTLGKMGTVTSTVETRNNNYMKAPKKKKKKFNSGVHKSWVSEFCVVVPKICGSSEWKFLHVTLTRILELSGGI